MITLIAGDDHDETKYLIHREYACFYSPVLKTRFSGDVPEGEMQTFVLDDCHQNVLRLFVQWVYRQEVCSTSSDDYYCDLMELWILGGKLCIPRLQNMVIDKLTSMPENLESGLCMAHNIMPAYLDTPDGSVLRKFAVAKCASYLTLDMLCKPYCPKEFILDYVSYIHAKLNPLDSPSWSISPSDYYVSED